MSTSGICLELQHRNALQICLGTVGMLYRYEQSCGGGFTGLWAFPLRYEDADQVAGYAYEALCWCTMKGVMSGYADNTLRPQNTATRAHMAAMLMRFCQIER